MNNYIFALDIGTRSVTGIILEKQGQSYTVVDFCVKEHQDRSMLDGQIQDVVAVADVIKDVKETLEQANGPLHKVCVAAAGRALKTVQATASIDISEALITNKETIHHLEISAVQMAQLTLAEQEDHDHYKNFYCVGYSILNYKLDGETISSLIDQHGNEASVDIIATFLPKIVVESLLAALNRANLDMEALTLEPIAAIHVLIPESMRRLNVALIDIGAGTSDIAITDKGSVVAYGMVPIAGDEITEAISDQYLLDFPKAEQTKRNIVTHGQDTASDILGFETIITYEDLVGNISEQVHELSSALAAEVRRLNTKSPKAVMLVGGGSLTPEITNSLAHQLQLPSNRVAVRGIDAVQQLNKNEKLPAGPDFVTPIAIAIASQQSPVKYINVTVNGNITRMFEMKELTISDSLIQAGMNINKFYGKPGLAMMITLNNKTMTIPGKYGKPPTIYLNDQTVTVNATIKDGDDIKIVKGEDGDKPSVTIRELVGETPSKTVYFHHKPFELQPVIRVNKESQTSDYIIQDKDVILLKQNRTIKHFFEYVVTDQTEMMDSFTIYVNNEPINLVKAQPQIFVNDEQVNHDYLLKADDPIKMIPAINPTVKELLEQTEQSYEHTIDVQFNGQPIKVGQKGLTVRRNGIELEESSPIEINDSIEIEEMKLRNFIFQDVFRYIDVDLLKANGQYKLYKNNEPSTFHDIIIHGDNLEIIWDEE